MHGRDKAGGAQKHVKLCGKVTGVHALHVMDHQQAKTYARLCSYVIHLGMTPSEGHYVTYVRSPNYKDNWTLYDDDDYVVFCAPKGAAMAAYASHYLYERCSQDQYEAHASFHSMKEEAIVDEVWKHVATFAYLTHTNKIKDGTVIRR